MLVIGFPEHQQFILGSCSPPAGDLDLNLDLSIFGLELLNECLGIDLLGLALIDDHIEFTDMIADGLDLLLLLLIAGDGDLLAEVDDQVLQVLVLGLELRHKQLIVVDMLHERQTLTVHNLAVFVVLLFQRDFHMFHSLHKAFLFFL